MSIERREASCSSRGEGVRTAAVCPINRAVAVVAVLLANVAGLRIRVVQLGTALHLDVSLWAVAIGGGLEAGQFLDPCRERPSPVRLTVCSEAN
jgi:hypothetical protein